MTRATLTGCLERAARSRAVVRFVDRRERETEFCYRELYARARAVAGGLREMGVQPGHRVALILPTCPGFFDAFFGAMLAGAVPVPVYPPVRLGRLDEYHEATARMLQSVGARLVISDRQIRRVLGKTMERARPELGLVRVDQIPRRGEANLPAVAASDTALIQLSSGTTVAPKPIRLTHGQVLANVKAILGAIFEAYPERPGGLQHKGVSWLPLYHDMGLVGCVMTAVYHAGDLTLIPPELFVARPAVWLRAISRHRATISPAPNFAYGLCVDRVTENELDGVDLSCWKVALNGAESVTPRVLQRFVERFQPHGLLPEAVTPVYGLAEATLAVTFSDLRRPFGWRAFDRQRLSRGGEAREDAAGFPLVSLGRPLPGFSLRIADPRGRALEPGHVGRVLVQGPSVMEAYHDQPEATSEALRDGWLDTGDQGFLLDGELYLHGRHKDLIILNGRNHAPQDIEQCLDDLPDVRTGCTAAVGWVPAGGDGERLAVLAERASGSRVDAAELRDQIELKVLERTGLKAHLVEVLEPGTLPRTSSGKIRRAEALRLHQEQALDAPRKVSTVRMMGAMVESHLAMGRSRRVS